MPELEYEYDALEPHIDAETMELHHSKHHAGYTAKLNAAIEGTEMDEMAIEELMVDRFDIPAVRNNGGGYWNHSLFWKTMSPDGGGEPSGALANSIDDSFGSFESMKEEFATAAMTRFGSGWDCSLEHLRRSCRSVPAANRWHVRRPRGIHGQRD